MSGSAGANNSGDERAAVNAASHVEFHRSRLWAVSEIQIPPNLYAGRLWYIGVVVGGCIGINESTPATLG
jgi:hypothetical protein